MRLHSHSNLDIEALERNLVMADIWKEQEEIRKLKTSRNKLAPVNRLALEILWEIFLLCATRNEGSHWSWVKLLRICQCWRDVVMSCPALWSCLDCTKPAAIPKLLERSKMAALTVRLDSGGSFRNKTANTVKSALQHLSRSTAECAHAAGSLSQCSMEAEHTVMLPLDLLGGDAPRLRHLDLKDFYLPWTSGLLKNLTSLKVHYTHSVPAPSFQQLTQVLNRMPALESLELRNALPLPNTTSLAQVVQLSRLTALHLEGEVAACTLLLDRITFPVKSTTTMKFTCVVGRDVAGHLEQASLFLHSLSKLRGQLPDSCPSVSQCTIPALKFLKLVNAQSLVLGNTSCVIDGSSPPWLELVIKSPVRELNLGSGVGFVQKLLSAILPLDQITVLTTNAPYIYWLLSNEVAIPSLQGVKQLHLQLEGQRECGLRTIDDLSEDTVEDTTAFPFFPLLESLSFKDFDFSTGRDGNAFERLRAMLQCRYESEAEIEELHLKGCKGLSSGDIEKLKEFCVDVKWDGGK
ncbi:hypothetical protein D9758_007499 [Tetrapyrgos nigripes]|uniref:F-box domain-containing protein n=1 Tax=Tetrapyrgos nigripes TaxID=182062 RepID=A0A8H5G3L2_9AGAR|nr:hypothetical protein D9758_007499 [Tetrapyrgos nigripes]